HHFDNERIGDGTKRLLVLKEAIVSDLKGGSPDGVSARDHLGAALHSIQDFYAHSNWVEMGHASDLQSALGRKKLATPAPTLVVCGPDQATLAGAGLTNLTSGYYSLPDPCTPAPAGKCLHGATFPT